ncbi:MAG: glycosyltransferase family 39 protein, partial [Candidatus Omnitrophica bacterium]|nr:glycosyltransferase family 39 protein [Candidatus Omnitrophota bacterium]
MKNNSVRIDIILLTATAALLILWRLGTGSLTSWDEGFYGGVSLEMIKSGDLVNLKWGGAAWSDKPPLYMWLTVFFSRFFGLGELSVRLFSALCGIGTILVTYLLGLKLYSRRAGIASALVLLSTWHFIWSSRVGMLDIPLTFFTSLSILFFVLGSPKNRLLFFSPIAFAMAFLIKGMGAITILVIIALYAAISGNFRSLKEKPLVLGIFIALIVLAAWHISIYASYGQDFWNGYVVKHLLVRTTSSLDGHTGDIFTYFGVIPNKGRPWSGAGLALIPILLWRVIFLKERSHYLPVIWAITVIGLFSPVQTKLHWYIMPVYPALALMTGWGITWILKKYTLPVAFLLSAGSVIYLGADKQIFNLDYSPMVKSVSVMAREAAGAKGGKEILRSVKDIRFAADQKPLVYLYDTGDPDIQFYLGDIAANIHGEE